jgi:hypothetical protein
MRTPFLISILVVSPLFSAPCFGQAQGDLIGGPPATKPAPSSTTPTPQAASTNAPGEAVLGFDRLAGFPFEVNEELGYNTNRPAWADAQVNAMIPAGIRATDGKKVVVEGFMMPVSFDDKGKLTSFLLTKNQPSCCYGGASQIHEFVQVNVSGPGVKWNMDDPIRVQGVLHVGAKRENGALSSVYRLDAVIVGDKPSK